MGRIKYEAGCGDNIPPLLQHVIIYFENKGFNVDLAKAFYHFYEGRSWKTERGFAIKNWKVLATNWIAEL